MKEKMCRLFEARNSNGCSTRVYLTIDVLHLRSPLVHLMPIACMRLRTCTVYLCPLVCMSKRFIIYLWINTKPSKLVLCRTSYMFKQTFYIIHCTPYNVVRFTNLIMAWIIILNLFIFIIYYL